MKFIKLGLLLFVQGFSSVIFLNNCVYSQTLPSINAIAGEGRSVNWSAIKAEEEANEGPGFFYNSCSQGVEVVGASSVLASQGSKSYSAKKLNDNNPMSAWVEGKTDYGIGEFFEIKSHDVNIIYNGYQSSPTNWLNNSRVKKFKVYRNNKPICYLNLKDEMGGQSFDLPNPPNSDISSEYVYKFEILEVYKGSKWADVAISEIDYVLCCVASETLILLPNSQEKVNLISKETVIQTYDVNNNAFDSTTVELVVNQEHVNLIKIVTETKSLSLTKDHPIFIKNFGFVSLKTLFNDLKCKTYEDLIGKIEILVIENNTTRFERLNDIQIINDKVTTYSIRKLSKGYTYVTNGFLSKTY